MATAPACRNTSNFDEIHVTLVMRAVEAYDGKVFVCSFDYYKNNGEGKAEFGQSLTFARKYSSTLTLINVNIYCLFSEM